LITTDRKDYEVGILQLFLLGYLCRIPVRAATELRENIII
jgi:hypothetical protein